MSRVILDAHIETKKENDIVVCLEKIIDNIKKGHYCNCNETYHYSMFTTKVEFNRDPESTLKKQCELS